MGSGRIKLAAAAAAGVFGLGLAWAPSALAFKCTHTLDTFNRPASPTLGAAWTEQAFQIGVKHHRATNPNGNFALATYDGAKSNSVCVDVYHSPGSSSQYLALVLGYKDSANNIFVKVQDNTSSGSFNRAFAYRGNNTFVPLGTSSDYKNLTPFTKAQLYLTWSGSTVKLLISTLFNNKAQQKFVITGVSTAGLGKKIGLGIWNGAFADNFAIP